MGKIMDTVIEFFDVGGIRYTVDLEGDFVKSGLCGDNGNFPMRIFANEEGETLILDVEIL